MNLELFDEIKKTIILMCGKVEDIIGLSLSLINNFNDEDYEKIILIEKSINRHHMEIDDLCYKFLALQQPVAKDLRYIIAWLRSNSDLERIGDQALNIAQTTVDFIPEDATTPPIIKNMIDEIIEMLKNTMDSLVASDVKKVKIIFEEEQRVNMLKNQSFRHLIKKIKAKEIDPTLAIEWILISKNLERIGDHATNIAENVIFIESGQDVRHPGHLKTKIIDKKEQST